MTNDREPQASDRTKRHQDLLNQRQALQLLGLDTLIYRTIHERIPFGWDRVITGLICFELIQATGVFGERPEEDFLLETIKEWDFLIGESWIRNWPGRGRDFRDIQPQQQVSFARAAAFLDLTSEWINCDDLHTYLTGVLRDERRRTRFSHFTTMRNGTVTWAVKGLLKLENVASFGETNWRGFNKYLDLSVDLNMFLSEQDGTSTWFRSCFGPWFTNTYSKFAYALLSQRFSSRFFVQDFRRGPHVSDGSTRQRRVGALSVLNFYAMNDVNNQQSTVSRPSHLASRGGQ